MLNKFLCKISPSEKKFLSEILKRDFNTTILGDLLKAGIDIDHCDEDGNTFLHHAIIVHKRRIKAVKWLLENGANPSIKNKQGQSPFQLAIKQENLALVQLLLETKKVNINETNSEGRTILHEAVMAGNMPIVEELINNNADINVLDNNQRNILFDAIAFGNEKLITTILETNKIDLNNIDINGHTVLHTNDVLENDELAKQLLEHGADPTINDHEGKNFLLHTALRGEEGLELLNVAIEKGCNLNGRGRDNNSILMEIMFAFSSISEAEKKRRAGLLEMAKVLVKNGINVNAINDQGETVLFDAVRRNDLEATAFLLEDGVVVNKRNKRFETALFIAVLKGVEALDIILLLLEYGADITIKVKDLKTILEVLNDIILHTHGNKQLENKNLLVQIDIENGQYLIVLRDILDKLTIPLDFNDSSGNPIYFKSLLYGNINLFKLYVKYGINVNQKNNNGRTLFHEYIIYSFKHNINIDDFTKTLLVLSSIKVNVNLPLEDGKTVLSYITTKPCDFEMFKVLISIMKFDYKLQDQFGRTVAHSCVTGDNLKILTLVYNQDITVINIPDYLGMLPITYAALMAKTEFVLELIKLDSFIVGKRTITTQAKEKFSKLLPNLEKLTVHVFDEDDKRKINILISQIRKDFSV